ncbi:TIGR00730 family Rossman fold protein [Pseudoroseicyclus sp. CXY001]|uniref:LOG family protein n=1 Tax=Pseudoroseicyclus sp. CXY001 TaxID=3242492 RepID=UPI003571504D
MPQTASICVYCGARDGTRPAYAEAAEAVGTLIARRGWRLVYGAGDVGLMGRTASAAKAAGGNVFGVIPLHLVRAEVGKRDIDSFVVTETMHERKKVMVMNADAIVVLPGGAGTLDEFFEVLTWATLGLHDKPIFLYGPEDYWAPLLALLGHIANEGFADPALATRVPAFTELAALEAALAEALG